MAIRRGEVYFVNLNPVVGREQGGRRPVVVVSRDEVNQRPLVVTVIPGTRGARVPTDYPWNARIPAGEANLSEETVFLCFQARALDHSRFTDPPIGTLSPAAMAEVEEAVAWVFLLTDAQGGTP
jgi:mRNA interferase MazF